MDLAVAGGATIYGLEDNLDNRWIEAGYPRSLYIELSQNEIKDEHKFLCVLPKGWQSQKVKLTNERDYLSYGFFLGYQFQTPYTL